MLYTAMLMSQIITFYTSKPLTNRVKTYIKRKKGALCNIILTEYGLKSISSLLYKSRRNTKQGTNEMQTVAGLTIEEFTKQCMGLHYLIHNANENNPTPYTQANYPVEVCKAVNEILEAEGKPQYALMFNEDFRKANLERLHSLVNMR